MSPSFAPHDSQRPHRTRLFRPIYHRQCYRCTCGGYHCLGCHKRAKLQTQEAEAVAGTVEGSGTLVALSIPPMGCEPIVVGVWDQQFVQAKKEGDPSIGASDPIPAYQIAGTITIIHGLRWPPVPHHHQGLRRNQ